MREMSEARAKSVQIRTIEIPKYRNYRGGGSETGFFLGAAVSHLEGTKTNQRAAVWESTGPPPCSRGGIWLYPDEHNQF